MRIALVLALIAVLLAIAASAFWLSVDAYSGQHCEFQPSGATECTTTNESLLEHEGTRVLWVLALPVALAGFVAALIALRAPRWLPLVVSSVLLVACLVSGSSVGLPYLPAAILSIVAVALDSTPTTPPPNPRTAP